MHEATLCLWFFFSPLLSSAFSVSFLPSTHVSSFHHGKRVRSFSCVCFPLLSPIPSFVHLSFVPSASLVSVLPIRALCRTTVFFRTLFAVLAHTHTHSSISVAFRSSQRCAPHASWLYQFFFFARFSLSFCSLLSC